MAASELNRWIDGFDERLSAKSSNSNPFSRQLKTRPNRNSFFDQIIGEALSQLAKDPALAERIPSYRETIEFRNLLIHGYAAVDHKRFWRIANESLPVCVGRRPPFCKN